MLMSVSVCVSVCVSVVDEASSRLVVERSRIVFKSLFIHRGKINTDSHTVSPHIYTNLQ